MLKSFVRLVVFMAVAHMLGSCHSAEMVEPIVVDRLSTEYITEYDTLRLRDSIFIKEYHEVNRVGDTIVQNNRYIEYHYSLSDHVKADTVLRTDTIPRIVEKKVTEYVEKDLSFWTKMVLALGYLLLANIVIVAILSILKYKKQL